MYLLYQVCIKVHRQSTVEHTSVLYGAPLPMSARANPGAVTLSQFEERKAELLSSKVIVAYW